MLRGWHQTPSGWWQRSIRGPRPPTEKWPRAGSQPPSQPGRSRAWPNKSGQQQSSPPPLQQPSRAPESCCRRYCRCLTVGECNCGVGGGQRRSYASRRFHQSYQPRGAGRVDQRTKLRPQECPRIRRCSYGNLFSQGITQFARSSKDVVMGQSRSSLMESMIEGTSREGWYRWVQFLRLCHRWWGTKCEGSLWVIYKVQIVLRSK